MKITTYQIVQKGTKVLMKVITQPVPLSAKSAKVAKYLGSKDQVAQEFRNQKSKDVHNQKQKKGRYFIFIVLSVIFFKYYFFSVNHLRTSFQYP